MATPQLSQVIDNARTFGLVNSLNNTTADITLNGINTTSFKAVTTGYIVTIWDEIAYADPSDDPNMEKAQVTAAVIGITGSLTLHRPTPKAHTGTPRIALLVTAQIVVELQNAVLALVNLVNKRQIMSPDGTVYAITIDNDGSLVTAIDSAMTGDTTNFPFGTLGLGFF